MNEPNQKTLGMLMNEDCNPLPLPQEAERFNKNETFDLHIALYDEPKPLTHRIDVY